MGNIGPAVQRYEVLPAPAWGIEDLIAQWRSDVPGEESETVLQSAQPDDR